MSQKGFEYEENAYKALEKYDISTGGVAGASHDKPDLTIKIGNKKIGCELKNSPTAAGSLVMKYYKGKWDYGEYKGEPEKELLVSVSKKVNLLREMNTSGSAGKKWRESVPILQNTNTGSKILFIGDIKKLNDKKTAYKKDIENFGADNEIHIDVGSKAVCDYYIAKKCSYINIGTHGFFTLDGNDFLDLNTKLRKNNLSTIPNFANNSETKIRLRCQAKSMSKMDYQFVLTLQFYSVKKSPYNIAPLRKGSNYEIDEKVLQKDPLLLAFK